MATGKKSTIIFLAKKVPLLMINASFLALAFLSFGLEINYVNPSAPKTILLKSDACASLHDFAGYAEKCLYVETHAECKPKGYINYLHIYYCQLGPTPLLGHTLLIAWLLILFYLLANTAADYFCPSLESLSKTLKLSPMISGITLLSLGNGAPDVFAGIISFTRSGDADLGLNSILGGAFFVSTVVVGVISLACPATPVPLDKPGFLRDVAFFLFALASLLVMFVAQQVNLFAAAAFLSIYFLYVCSVSAAHFFCSSSSSFSCSSSSGGDRGLVLEDEAAFSPSIPLLVYADNTVGVDEKGPSRGHHRAKAVVLAAARLLELPLYLPRRMTIPMATEEMWSKPYAVASVTLAPVLTAVLCNTQSESVDSRAALVTFMVAVLVGLVLGNLACVTTSHRAPPRQCLFPWLVAGFLMSVTWTYIAAEELVSLLFSLGNVFGVSPSILGLTVLAWGNSIGDLIANVAMAVRGGPDGAQIAVSGCYAGPMFNTVVGVGFSLVISAWSEYPRSYVVPSGQDRSLYETVGFLIAGLLWALFVLPSSDMRLDRRLGVGLLAIYSCFLLVRLTGVFGIDD